MKKQRLVIGVVALGLLICAGGIHLGEKDDAPGAALLGILLLIGAITLAVKIWRRKT